MTTAFQIALAIIAGYVAVGLYRKENRWAAIVGYWCVLTLKNILEVLL